MGQMTENSSWPPIHDTRMYQVEFSGGKVTESTTIIIAQSIYAQCDVVGNEYLLLYLIVDHCKDNKAITLTEHQISIQGRPIIAKTTTGLQIWCQ